MQRENCLRYMSSDDYTWVQTSFAINYFLKNGHVFRNGNMNGVRCKLATNYMLVRTFRNHYFPLSFEKYPKVFFVP
jgi:hypothetical protein